MTSIFIPWSSTDTVHYLGHRHWSVRKGAHFLFDAIKDPFLNNDLSFFFFYVGSHNQFLPQQPSVIILLFDSLLPNTPLLLKTGSKSYLG